MNQNLQVQLQAPGAGLPWIQRVFLKTYLGPFKSRFSDWEENEQRFVSNCQRIQNLLLDVPPNQLEIKTLIQPMGGLEDSSRNWSIAETLEHITLVSWGMYEIIQKLSHSDNQLRVVKIEEVKPKGQISGPETVKNFTQMQNQLLPILYQNMGDRRSKASHHHPWFGPFTAHQWFWILGIHVGIHSKQIHLIKKGLVKG